MAKWTRVGDIPKKIPVNFVVDSDKYPVLARWIYSFPHGEMGKTVRDILNAHALAAGTGDAGGGRGDVLVSAMGAPREVAGGGAPQSGVSRPERQSVPIVQDAAASREAGGDSGGPAGMDAGTAKTLNQLDQGF